MKDLVKLTYDFFGHVLPGVMIFLSLSLLYAPIAPQELFNWLETNVKMEAGVGTVIIIISYIIGFAINPFGRYLYKKLGLKIWPKKEKNKVEMYVSDKFALIREKSPKNFEYIERWNTYCAMAHNLAIASLILALVSVFKIITIIIEGKDFYLNLWLPILLFSVFMFFVLLYRAVIFSIWAADDVNATVSRLILEEKDLKN